MSNKKMNLGNLKTLESKTFTKKKVIVDKYEVEIDEVFRESTIQEMMKEFLLKMDYAQKNNIEMNPYIYAALLLIKYFSDVDVPEDFEQQIQMYYILTDLNYLNPILEAFDEKEMDKVIQRTYELKDRIPKITEEINKRNEEMGLKSVEESESVSEIVEE